MLSLRDRSRTYRSPKKFGEAMTPIFDLNFKYFTYASSKVPGFGFGLFTC